MTQSIHSQNKERIGRLRAALYDCDASKLQGQLREIFAADCVVHLTNPLEDLDGADGFYEGAYAPLLAAVPDLERRDFIVMAGESKGGNWVACCGHYMGVFERPWLGIPPTQHLLAMRYHEFFRLEDGMVVEMQALWDIPQVMMQVGAWPMAPSLAVEWIVPGPATEDGLISSPYDEAKSAASLDWVTAMLRAMQRSPEGVEAMELDRYWHEKMMWYGPGRDRFDAAEIGFPQLASDSLFEGAARSWCVHRERDHVRRWRLCRVHRLARHVDDDKRRWLVGHRAVESADHDAQSGFLALRERRHPRELGAD